MLTRSFIFYILRPKNDEEFSMEVRTPQIVCSKKKTQQLEELVEEFKEVFQEPKGLPPKREV